MSKITLKKPPFKYLVTLSVVLFCLSCSSKKEQPQQLLLQEYVRDFHQATWRLTQGAKAFQYAEITQDSLQQLLAETRLAYKAIEFWVAYRFPEYAKTNFNGAPLLKAERSRSKSSVIPPHGLQILDELIYGDTAEENSSKIASLAGHLKNSFDVLQPELSLVGVDKNELVLAMRLQLVRVFALGVSGFDTPGSLRGLPETRLSLWTMREILAEQPWPGLEKVLDKFKEAGSFITNSTSFEAFDRLTFLTDYIDPLYKALLKYQKGELPESLNYTTPWNPESQSLFAEDFLNPYFFTELNRVEDSEALRDLGEALFYDERLSGGQNMSCASCHQPEKAFTDGRSKSMSNRHGETVLRNAPSLLNAVYADRYFYDLRAFSLEQQAEHVIFNSKEFNTAYSEIVAKLKADQAYVKQFKNVFGEKEVNRENFSKALASYVMSLRSFNSLFDQYVRGERDELKPSVRRGFNLFMGKAACATCHFPPTFKGLVPPLYRDTESEILGVLADPNADIPKLSIDKGRYSNGVSSEHVWIYKRSFKTSTVRNVELTAPYFHNGAYKTLDEVMEFYNNGGGAGIGLKVANQTLAADSLKLTNREIADLIAFMKALTDNPFADKKSK